MHSRLHTHFHFSSVLTIAVEVQRPFFPSCLSRFASHLCRSGSAISLALGFEYKTYMYSLWSLWTSAPCAREIFFTVFSSSAFCTKCTQALHSQHTSQSHAHPWHTHLPSSAGTLSVWYPQFGCQWVFAGALLLSTPPLPAETTLVKGRYDGQSLFLSG